MDLRSSSTHFVRQESLKEVKKMKLTNKQIIAIIAIIFGILVLILPDFLNYLVALFLIVYGIISLIPSKKKAKK